MAAPTLISSDSGLSTKTYFVSIDIGEPGVSLTTGIFVPDGFHEPSQIDVILWLMGHHNNSEYPANLSIDQYWRNYQHFKFREFVNAGHKNVVLVAPSLGPGSEAGRLVNQGGLSWYLDQVVSVLHEMHGLPDDTLLGDLVIACHSGGGAPMLKIATTTQRYSNNIKQCWGFDCLYNAGSEDAWVKWADGNGGKKLRIRYGSGGTADRSRNLKRMAGNRSNIEVDGLESTDHNKVPVTYWNKFMRDAHFFLDT